PDALRVAFRRRPIRCSRVPLVRSADGGARRVSKPAITVAIPFHDEQEHLASAVRSVLRQTCKDFELLLVDDGSRDASLSIARSFSDPRVAVVSDGRSRGLPARLNEIARRASADLVARMDADDVIHPTRLEKQV